MASAQMVRTQWHPMRILVPCIQAVAQEARSASVACMGEAIAGDVSKNLSKEHNEAVETANHIYGNKLNSLLFLSFE